MVQVTEAVTLPIRVDRSLRVNGLDMKAVKIKSYHYGPEFIGVSFRRTVSLPYKCLWWRRKRVVDINIGTLYLVDMHKRVKLDKNWILEVTGRQYLASFRRRAEELAVEFNVDIHVRLVEERATIPQEDYSSTD